MPRGRSVPTRGQPDRSGLGIPPAPAPTSAPAPAPAPSANGTPYVPTEEWTWRLLERGFTLDEAAAIRGLDRSAVVRHATLAARQGKPIDPAALLDPETLRRWG